MDESWQIMQALSPQEFWEDNQRRGWSMSVQGGLSMGVDQQGLGWNWRITRPDGSHHLSPQPFSSVPAAKAALRAELQRRREGLVYESIGPANMSL
jgi:hypothetical protein